MFLAASPRRADERHQAQRHGNFPPSRVVVAFHVLEPLAIIYSFYLRLLGAFAGNFDACSESALILRRAGELRKHVKVAGTQNIISSVTFEFVI